MTRRADRPDTVTGVMQNRRWSIALDSLAALGYLLVFALAAVLRTDLPLGLTGPLLLVVGAPLAVRRVWPTQVFVIVFAASVAAFALGVLADPFLAATFALYPVAVQAGRTWVAAPVVGVASITVLIIGSAAGLPDEASHRFGVALLAFGLLTGVWTIGRLARDRREQAEQSATDLARRAVAEERLRIAREMHDVVAHSMSLIAVKAGAANHVVARRPGEAQEALKAIESTSRTALAEMRSLLSVLRSGEDELALSPQPGTAGLPALAKRTEQAGVPVELDLRGLDDVPDGVGVSVFRIVQESLTNVVRHAAPARCKVSVVGRAGEVLVEVTDDGPGARASPSGRIGQGLMGMRERALMFGGSFEAGPRVGGGFAVSARLPYEQ